jgi:hypothetical protein
MFVQIIQGQTADRDELKASTERWIRDLSAGAPGWLGDTAGVTADGRAIAIVRFESEEAARHNSERPEQHQWWMETSKLFAGDVTFHDCRDIRTMGAGGSDEAGFVQVIQGRCTDVARADALMERTEPALREHRPDVIGGQVYLYGDDEFTQVMYFTSEAAAREGEQHTPPPDAQAALAELMSLMVDTTYADLTTPWLYSARR